MREYDKGHKLFHIDWADPQEIPTPYNLSFPKNPLA